MKIYYMDIHAAQISVFRTGTKTKSNEVFEEIDECLEDILTWISYQSDDFPYDETYALHSKKNRKAVKTFRGWMKKLKRDNDQTIREGDVWIALLTEEIPDPPERELSVHEMEFYVAEQLIHRTSPCTHVNRVIHETLTERNVILDNLARYVADLDFDETKPDDEPENREAVEAFDYWMSRFALHAFEPHEFKDGDILIRLSRNDLLRGSDFPEVKISGVHHEIP